MEEKIKKRNQKERKYGLQRVSESALELKWRRRKVNMHMNMNRMNKILVFLMAFWLQFAYDALLLSEPVSFGDICCLLIILLNMHNMKGIILPKQIIYMLIWVVIVFLEALFLAPYMVGHDPKLLRIGYEAVYFLVLLLYMTTAYLIARLGLDKYFIRCIVYMTSIIASLSVVSEVTKSPFLKKIFYFMGMGIRFQGIAVNPNMYIVLALISIAYFMYSQKESCYIRVLALGCLYFSALASGSKSGIVVLAILTFARVWKQFVNHIRNRREIITMKLFFPLVLSSLIVLAYFAKDIIAQILLRTGIQGVDRIVYLLENPIIGLDADGSGRLQTWLGTIIVWKTSPIIGVGIGSHEQVLKYMGYQWAEIPPHNIFLELLEQNGIIGAFLIAGICGRFIARFKGEDEYKEILKNSFIYLLIYGAFTNTSWYIAFWIIIGLMLYRQENTSSVRLKVNRYSYQSNKEEQDCKVIY